MTSGPSKSTEEEANAKHGDERVDASASSGESEEASLRDILPFVIPFGLFLVLTSFEGQVEEQGFYPAFYTLKIALVGVSLFFCRQAFPKFSNRGVLLGVVAGILGTFAWIGLTWLDFESVLREYLPSWIMAGPRAGYNPFGEAAGLDLPSIAFVAVRLVGLAIIVPLLEELFWRGFLIRYLTDADFRRLPYGQFTTFAFAFVTIAFMLVHTEWLAALAWGAAINGLLYYSRNLWACIVMHAVTNALLGAWILSTGSWQLW